MGTRKGIQFTTHKPIIATLESMSKACLGDLVLDLLRESHGAELDGMELQRLLVQKASIVTHYREDKAPLTAESWAKQLRRNFGSRADALIEAELNR